MDNELLNAFGAVRINDRQIDELIGLAKGIVADGSVHQREAEFLQSWLAANVSVSGNRMIGGLYRRVASMLSDGVLDDEERHELFETLTAFGAETPELGEPMKATSLPLTNPFPIVEFSGRRFAFTGTFNFGDRRDCESAVSERGAEAGSLTAKTHFLVIGSYATESWKHSSFGNKIIKACEMRDKGVPIHIVSEVHWVSHLA